MPTSPLKQLNAYNCSIQQIHESFLRTGVEIDLRNNEISELPRDEMLKFLNGGGNLRYPKTGDVRKIKHGGIAFDQNPLVYPPKQTFEEGRESIAQYLSHNLNSMVDPNDISICQEK